MERRVERELRAAGQIVSVGTPGHLSGSLRPLQQRFRIAALGRVEPQAHGGHAVERRTKRGALLRTEVANDAPNECVRQLHAANA